MTEIAADELKMLGKRPEGAGPSADDGPATYSAPAHPAPARSGLTAPPREPTKSLESPAMPAKAR